MSTVYIGQNHNTSKVFRVFQCLVLHIFLRNTAYFKSKICETEFCFHVDVSALIH